MNKYGSGRMNQSGVFFWLKLKWNECPCIHCHQSFYCCFSYLKIFPPWFRKFWIFKNLVLIFHTFHFNKKLMIDFWEFFNLSIMIENLIFLLRTLKSQDFSIYLKNFILVQFFSLFLRAKVRALPIFKCEFCWIPFGKHPKKSPPSAPKKYGQISRYGGHAGKILDPPSLSGPTPHPSLVPGRPPPDGEERPGHHMLPFFGKVHIAYIPRGPTHGGGVY